MLPKLVYKEGCKKWKIEKLISQNSYLRRSLVLETRQSCTSPLINWSDHATRKTTTDRLEEAIFRLSIHHSSLLDKHTDLADKYNDLFSKVDSILDRLHLLTTNNTPSVSSTPHLHRNPVKLDISHFDARDPFGRIFLVLIIRIRRNKNASLSHHFISMALPLVGTSACSVMDSSPPGLASCKRWSLALHLSFTMIPRTLSSSFHRRVRSTNIWPSSSAWPTTSSAFHPLSCWVVSSPACRWNFVARCWPFNQFPCRKPLPLPNYRKTSYATAAFLPALFHLPHHHFSS